VRSEFDSSTENAALKEAIVARIQERGPITFRDFMALALYHPHLGYYCSPREKMGRSGDYLTSSEVSPIFGALVGRQRPEMWDALGRPPAFQVAEGNGCLGVSVLTENRRADVSFDSGYPGRWRGTPLFGDMDEASQFFERGDCGFSSRLRGGGLEGMWLRSLRWDMIPLFVRRVRTAFFEDPERFPRGSVEFDCALLMRGIPHDWHPLSDVPGLESVAAGKRR